MNIPFTRDDDDIVIEAGDLRMGDFVICTADPDLKETLLQRWKGLVSHRHKNRIRRKEEHARKLAAVRNDRFRVKEAAAVEATEVSAARLWNPLKEEHNAFQWTAGNAGEKKGVSWDFRVDQADVPYLIGLHLRGRLERSGGNAFDIVLEGAHGKTVQTDSITLANGHGAGTFGEYTPIVHAFEWRVTFPAPGEYTLRLWQGKQRHKWFPSTAQVARHIYVKPKDD